MNLQNLGFSNWFQKYVQENGQADFKVARVTAVNKDNYVIRNENTELLAEITGKIMFGAESKLDYPTVGDWVFVQYFDDDSFAIIQDIFPRQTLLKRKISGKETDFQLIAANIDTAFVLQSFDNNFNLRRLERYLVMINEGKIQPVILFSKCDLLEKEEIETKIIEAKKIIKDYEMVVFSSESGVGLDRVRELIKPGKSYCLLGSSGVGKTTLLNKLLGKDILRTDIIREKDGKGKHTTSRRELLILENNGIIIDTPGMRELGNFDINEGINETFADIESLSSRCKFNDCTHINEPGCAILKAVEDGEINQKRYENFIKLRKETAYYERSYLEKRKRDKEFGKMVKSVMKFKKRI
ncbi:ribosome small subunit-dependent GTPase A [candidate division KSB1 bacterium]|nr:ribosome small subunit-dependent GTPase A [candidate division KSB1 bacterium]MBL7093805.1 ribosome small subunit-dependent GTPase A [candidate division KSB1 bacterium]